VKHEEMLMYPDEYRVMFEIEDQYWWYRGVRTLIKAWLDRYTPANAMILDGGCGTGANLKLLQGYGTAIGIDISDQALHFSHARGVPADRAFLASLTELPFPKDHFDIAISFEVICNIADDQTAFDEIARVLKPGGRLIVQIPAYQWLWGMHDVAVGHQRRYSARDLRRKLERAGLVIERLTHANALMFPAIAADRLARRLLRDDGAIHSDLTPLPRGINAILSALYVAEMTWVAHADVPCGVSLLARARKK
jgi:SAM-dependent methyltransferase